MFEYEDLIGLPFVDGGRGPAAYDCWGLAMELFKRQGKPVKDYPINAVDVDGIANQMHKDESLWHKLEAPKEGCLVLLRLTPGCWANHVGIYIGYGRFIHAYVVTGVCTDRLRKWKSRIVGFYEPGRKS